VRPTGDPGSEWLAGWASEASVAPVEPWDSTTCGDGKGRCFVGARRLSGGALGHPGPLEAMNLGEREVRELRRADDTLKPRALIREGTRSRKVYGAGFRLLRKPGECAPVPQIGTRDRS
jgi:hypothetical protein